jgi:DNA-binding MarR family transcriptional regulator
VKLDPSKKLLLHLFLHVGKILQDTIRGPLGELGMHHGKARVLMAISIAGQCNQHQLARILNIKPPTLSRMFDPLQVEGLVERTIKSEDKRFAIFSVTDKGDRKAQKAFSIWQDVENRLLSKLTQQEIDILRDILPRVLESFNEQLPEKSDLALQQEKP